MHSPEDYTSEQALFEEMKAAQAEILRSAGVLGKAMELAGITDDGFVGSRLYQVRRKVASGDAPDAISTEINLGTREVRPDGNVVFRGTHVKVAETLGGVTLPVEPFSDEDAALVRSLLGGISMARDMGVLPHVSPDLGSVSNPYQGLMRMPVTSEPDAGTQS